MLLPYAVVVTIACTQIKYMAFVPEIIRYALSHSLHLSLVSRFITFTNRSTTHDLNLAVLSFFFCVHILLFLHILSLLHSFSVIIYFHPLPISSTLSRIDNMVGGLFS